MRSAAHIKGHPVHPALIPFPLAFLTGSALFDLAGRLWDRPAWWTTGGYLAPVGIAAALLAAVPGLIDYLKSVPPRSSGKQRATTHMIVNLSAVALFALSCILRGGAATEPGLALLGLKIVGLGLLAAGGWLGGTLVSRNQISVDHRYARAGRWSEITVEAKAGTPVEVAEEDELKPDQMKLIHTGGKRIVLARTENGWAAFDDRCTHKGGSLADGTLIHGTVQCPWHGSQFAVKTGAVTCGPATAAVKSYTVSHKGGKIFLTL
jgi:nitrite reductase/ring-hydroxylating ferredoxin subunit/uncharacterized membrane protein